MPSPKTPHWHVPATSGRFYNDDWCDEYKAVTLRLAGELNLQEYLAALANDPEGRLFLPIVRTIVGHEGRHVGAHYSHPHNASP